MATVDGGPVLPHVQAFADEIVSRFGVRCSTYEGHQPTRTRALDIWGTRAQRDAVCEFYITDWQRFGGDYVIDQQRIWNPEVSRSWRGMADRGNDTANHFDHVHVSFELTGATQPTREDDLKPDERAALLGLENTVREIQAALWDPNFGLLKANGGVTAQLEAIKAKVDA